ncbi:His-Xaa-Ser system radical SAM maturase HxsC [Sphingomonas sp. HF-S4]|uniref:His-Xaa-Ser system radical SAM maturase HxsC n=1 Tax=Sphingomonas agrestis TaxID=3080540 RepID=A0ABU3Y397_9SPHN|nr:His-Xaa-Ser system radical SAM maturase HxsC [Sphingomonas sp. HF-S4]MDV3455834.1 His-Xaa-Ser system radical SAM maturase HxsC [Sphingomonas sp. HF-S4]
MIELTLPALAEAPLPFVARLRTRRQDDAHRDDAFLCDEDDAGVTFAGAHGLLAIDGMASAALDGDVVLVQPDGGRVERLLRAGSPHNTLLVTERCDQLCVMCSQPPKKTHIDRFALLEQACLLAEADSVIGISGGEPTLYKGQLLSLIERIVAARPDLAFHVLTNGQHFEAADVARLRNPLFAHVLWGIPLYARDPGLHDLIVGKTGAFARLEQSLAHLVMSGARIELRTVLVQDNLAELPALARYVTTRLRFLHAWSIMQLEHVGFARNRWAQLYVNHSRDFAPIAAALDHAKLHGMPARLFNFPRCTVPEQYRYLAAASISDWKRRYVETCGSCREREACTGFFEWHPDAATAGVHPL